MVSVGTTKTEPSEVPSDYGTNEVAQLGVSSIGQAPFTLMEKGGTTSLMIIFSALCSIHPLSSLRRKLRNGLPMSVITFFQFALLSIVLQLHQPISQPQTWDCRAPFSFVDCNLMKITT